MSKLYPGTCHCNQIELYLNLPLALSDYSPRACDCDFCSEHDLMYVSDPQGTLEIVSTISLQHLRQGSQQAEFLRCANCEQIVAVVANIDGEYKGAINSDCLHDADLLSAPTPVSPKALSKDEKKARWAKHWSKVKISEPD
ncbi:aldehyde-activating protein [Glaciecola siphonariae]|uniref:Aldehyde-activating protein n=1 Tax=Glaciecola siphonariae TaxID=521012 RepID=A0ABV9LQM1_9ALTE